MLTSALWLGVEVSIWEIIDKGVRMMTYWLRSSILLCGVLMSTTSRFELFVSPVWPCGSASRGLALNSFGHDVLYEMIFGHKEHKYISP